MLHSVNRNSRETEIHQTLQFFGQIKVEVAGVIDRRGHRLQYLASHCSASKEPVKIKIFLVGRPPTLRKEFFRAIPVDQLKSVWHSVECSRRCRQGLVNRAVATFMRIVRLFLPIQFPANEEK